jgi:hypothetical protein
MSVSLMAYRWFHSLLEGIPSIHFLVDHILLEALELWQIHSSSELGTVCFDDDYCAVRPGHSQQCPISGFTGGRASTPCYMGTNMVIVD